jgi:hypothetical protein
MINRALVPSLAFSTALALAADAQASPPKKIPEGPAAATDLGVRPAPAPPGAERPVATRPVAAILADVVAAMGGEAAWSSHKTMFETFELTFAGLGMNGTGERTATKDDRSLLTTQLPGIGTSREGSNGKVLWSEDPINGLRLLAGAEAEIARIESAWAPELHFAKLFKKIEAANETGPGGVALECLVLTPREAPPLTNCYDATTHLQVLQKGSHPTPQGDTPFTSTLKDWRNVQGLKMPFAVETQTGPITFNMRITELKLDVPVDEKTFEPPAGAVPAGKGKTKGQAKKAKAATKPAKAR